MKNLKKVLALVLAFACAFTMFAGAAFTDQADLAVDSDVVNTLVSLGVIDGYEDGSFRPDDTVTRAEMAKMIYVVRTGRSDASAYNDDATTFTDITYHWARGYIKYCQSLGIIAGKSATSFDPDATVTTQEAAKMLLVTLGYDAEKAGLEGASWGQKTNALADENGLLKDVNNGTTAGLPRQYAAQLIYNAVNAHTVVYRDGEYTKYNYNGDENPTIGVKYMNLDDNDEGVLTYVKKEDGKDTYRITVAGVDTFTKVSEDYSALLGETVKILYEKDANDKVYGVFSTEDNVVITAVADDVDDINTTAGKLEINDVAYKTEYTNANNLPVFTTPDMSAFGTIDDLVDDYPYYTVKFVDCDDNDKLDYALVTPVVAAQIDNLSTSSITVSAIDLDAAYGVLGLDDNAPDLDDVNLYDGAAEDDYVAIVDADYTVDGKMAITKLETVSGSVDATRSAGTEFRTSGEWYKIAADDAVTLNDEYDFAVIGSFVFALDATATSVSASNILYVGDAAPVTSGVNKGMEATVYFADGTSATVMLTKLDGDKIYDSTQNSGDYGADHFLTAAAVADLKGSMFKFTKKSDTEYEIKTLTQGSYDQLILNAAGDIDEGKFDNDDNTNDFRMADEAVVFVTEANGDVSIKTGKSVSNWNAATAVTKASALTTKTSGYQYAKIACLTIGTAIPSSSDYLYGYVTSDVSEIDSDGTKYEFDIWTGSETITVTTEDDDVTEKGQFIAYSVDGDLINIELTVKDTDDAAAIMAYDADTIAFSDLASTDFADEYVVIGVNTEKQEGVAGGKLAVAKETVKGSGNYWKNAVYFVDGGEVAAVFVDTQGKMYDQDAEDFIATDAVEIDAAAITLTAPVKGEAPATTATTSTTGLRIKSVEWLTDSDDAFEGETFDATTTYKAKITVEPINSIYELGTITATVNGKGTGEDSYTIAYDAGVITVTFPATEA